MKNNILDFTKKCLGIFKTEQTWYPNIILSNS